MPSETRKKFEAAAKAEKWQEAFNNCNALSMEEMLLAYQALPKATVDKLIERRHAYKVGLDMPRMEYAWTVVRTRKLPLIAPNDLMATGQVKMAADFLKTTVPTAPSVKLNLIVFTDGIVTNRTLAKELVQKAQKVLDDQGGAFKLEVVHHPTDLQYNERIYLTTQIEEMAELANKATTVAKNQLRVLMVRVKENVDIHGIAAKDKDGRRIVAIDTDNPNPDRMTLLHEAGHCAPLPHAGEPPAGKAAPVDVGDATNFMAEPKAGVTRSTVTVTRGEALANAFFATK
jgi:hypothetical protein